MPTTPTLSLDDRKKAILSAMIEEYVKTCHPVGSLFLVEGAELDVSSATVRHELAELEEEGYVVQPHTSAGRIPTDKAFCFYVNHVFSPRSLSTSQERKLTEAWSMGAAHEESMRHLAQALAHFSDLAILVALSSREFYYTGISNLFRQPEFQQPEVVIHLGEVMDRLNEVTESMLNQITSEIQFYIGKENPYGNACGLVVSSTGNKGDGMLGILGPVRMDYAHAHALLQHSKSLIVS